MVADPEIMGGDPVFQGTRVPVHLIAGIRAFAVHAKDAAARRVYDQFDFVPSPTDPMHLFVLIKDLRRLIEA